MKRFLLCLFIAMSIDAEELPSAPQILASARAQLPPHSVIMIGTLKEKAPNGFIKKKLTVEMKLDWNAQQPRAEYRIKNPKTDELQTLDILWHPGGPEFIYSENGEKHEPFDPNSEINGLGVTWADLSFAFLWNPDAQTRGTDKKLGKACYLLAVPRPTGELLLWIEQKTGRLLGAEERDATGLRKKIIKVVSVKEFDGLWMIKDLDIIIPSKGGKTSLRIDEVREVE